MSDRKKTSAISGESEQPYQEEFRTMGELLERDAEQIMERWFKRATDEQVHEDPKEREDAMNNLLQMLQTIGRRLQKQSSQALEDATQVARGHGRQRSDIGRGIIHVVNDYEILHSVALEHLGEALSERLNYRQATVLAAVIARASGSAVEAFSDLTKQKLDEQVRRQQEEIRQLALDLTDAKHRERQQVAQTLHDDFQQLLVAARMKLQACLRSQDLSAVEEANKLLDQMLEVSRNVTADLHPAALETQTLPAAIQWLGETFQQRYGLTVNVNLQVSSRSNPEPKALRRLIYDAIRELLFNIVKHGQTDQAWVKICCGEESPWRFEVEDRGVGTPDLRKVKEHRRETSLGLASVARSIKEIGGTMDVDSKPGRGTRIVLTVPVELATEKEESQGSTDKNVGA